MMSSKIQQLHGALSELITILKKDPTCQWTKKFEVDLYECEKFLLKNEFEVDFTALSKSITEVFQGMGSFNDYSPSIYDEKTGRYVSIPGTERFDDVSSHVFDLAMSLRVGNKHTR